MCGLVTFVRSAGPSVAARRDAVAAALQGMHHRGPDATGVEVVGDDVIMGFKRLSIIDVDRSHQPLRYAEGRYAIVFNGEIYNYLELRDELIERHGARFTTCGDTEVLVAAYHHWGPAALHRLRGMFAFVIWDTASRRLFGARDRFGIKPLHYLELPDGLYVASEKKALLPFTPAARRGDAGLDAERLAHYLTLQYVPEPGTLHRGITRLGAGEWFSYSPGDHSPSGHSPGGHSPGGRVETGRYYRPEFRPTRQDDPAVLYRRILDVLRDSVRVHMRSDVPVGAFLSGGIDSTAIVALAHEVNPNLPVFTAALEVPGYSELEVAERSAEALGVSLHPVVVTAQMMMDALPRIVWHLDDPVADPSLVPLYYLARKASEQVTVALSGEGADEFFGGYRIYREPASLRPASDLPYPLRRALRSVARLIPEGVKGRSFLQRATTDITQRYYGNARLFTEREKAGLLRRYDPGTPYTRLTEPVYAECAHLADVEKMQYVDLATWLPGDILVKADRMSMAHSLEVRVPYLDHKVFEVASRIPTQLKVPSGSPATKVALRRALRDVVPAHVIDRPKLGFPTPIRVWLRDEMYPWAAHLLDTSGAGGLLDLGYARRLLDEHRAGSADHSRKIWAVLVLCVWHGIFVEQATNPLEQSINPVGRSIKQVDRSVTRVEQWLNGTRTPSQHRPAWPQAPRTTPPAILPGPRQAPDGSAHRVA